MHRCSPRSSPDHTRGSLIYYREFVGARPTDAKVAAFAFGRARGVIEGCAGALLPIVFLTPSTWKRLADIPPGAENKDFARTRAIARWPARADLFARKCDVDRGEAALIGWAGLQWEAGRLAPSYKASRFVCAWCDVYCRVERVQHDEAGREIIRDSVCAYCGRTELRFALGRQTPIPKLSVRPDGLPF